MGKVATKYDKLYQALGLGLPVAFMRSLAHMESGQDPQNKTGGQWGLFQISVDQVADYNKRAARKVEWPEVLSPDINTQVWAWLMRRWIDAAGATGIKNLKENWENPEFVKLLIAAHNGGGWTKGGVLKIAKWLRARRLPVTHDNLFKYGKQAGGYWPFWGDSKVAAEKEKALAKKKFQKGVYATWWLQKKLPHQAPTLPGEEEIKQAEAKADLDVKRKGANWPWLLVLGLIAYEQSKR